jgi:hypothetical protein
MRLRVLVAVVTAAALLSAACGLYDDHPYALPTAPTQASVNLLQNAGFEDTGVWTPSDPGAFSISEQAHAGLESGELRGTKKGVAASQPVADATTIPEFVSGYYRLNGWKPPAGADAEVGLRVTVRAGGADFILHFSFGGLQATPAGTPGNERYVFLSRGAPATGAWTYFGYAVAAAFKDQFGLADTGIEGIAVGIELRGEGTQAWFDDVYAGTQARNPNRPAR